MVNEASRKPAEKADDRMNWRYQDKAYNELFKKWRRQHSGGHGFYYADNPNELVYKDGYGFVKNYPEAVETEALSHVFNIIGFTILLIVGADILYLYVVPVLLGKLGADIYYDFFAGEMYGSSWLIIALYTFFEIVKRLIPFMYCYKKLNMPLKVMLPMRVANKPLFRACVPAMLLTSGVCCVLSLWSAYVMSIFRIEPDRWLLLPDDPYALAASLAINIILVPAVSELYIRGPVMQLLRQFGDGSAIIFTALLTTLITYGLHHFCYVFITSVVIGYFVLRTGSIMTGIIMRIVCRAVSCGLYMCSYYLDGSVRIAAYAALILPITLFGAVYMINYMFVHKGKLGMQLKARYLSFSSKCFIILTSLPTMTGLTVAFVFSVLRIKFSI